MKGVAEIRRQVGAKVEDGDGPGVKVLGPDQPPVGIQVEVGAGFQLQRDDEGVVADWLGEAGVPTTDIEREKRHATSAGAGPQPRRVRHAQRVWHRVAVDCT